MNTVISILQLFFCRPFHFHLIGYIYYLLLGIPLCALWCKGGMFCLIHFFCSCIVCSTYLIWFLWHLLWYNLYTFWYIVSFPVCHSVLCNSLFFHAYLLSFFFLSVYCFHIVMIEHHCSIYIGFFALLVIFLSPLWYQYKLLKLDIEISFWVSFLVFSLFLLSPLILYLPILPFRM